MAPNHRNFFFFVSVVTLLRREVVNLERRKVVSLNRRTVVSLTGASSYIKNAIPKPAPASNGHYNWRYELDKGLLQTLGREAYINEMEGKLQIQTSNKYEAFIANGRTNDFRIFGILSGKEFDFATSNRNIFQASKMEIELQEGRKGYYDTVWGTIKGIKSHYINELKNEDQLLVVDATIKFISGIEQLKKMVR